MGRPPSEVVVAAGGFRLAAAIRADVDATALLPAAPGGFRELILGWAARRR